MMLPHRFYAGSFFLLALGIVAGAMFESNAVAADPSQKPNVLFIAIDDLRPELGVYDSKAISPNIDRLARRGTLFLSAYCQQALCMPSRASLLTGRRPDTTGVFAFNPDFRAALPDVVTLPQHFKKNGYHTQALGKIFHNDDPRSWSAPLWRSKLPQWQTELGKNVLHWIKDDYRRIKFTWHLGNGNEKHKRMGGLPWEAPDVPDNHLRDGETTERAIALIRQLKDKPFFLAVGFDKPHLPFVAPKKYFDLYDLNKIKIADNPNPPTDVPQCAMYNWNDMRHYYRIPKVGPVSDLQARELIRAYYACVSFVDAQVGRLLDELKQQGLENNTIVMLWGDHGWQLGEHGMWDKHSNFETSTHAPLMIHVPGQQSGRTDALVEFVDMYPTLCELCRLPLPAGLEGSSFAPLIENPQLPWKSAVFSQHPREVPGYGYAMGYSMRTKRYRFAEWTVKETDFRALELYDHKVDPGENVNLANRPENAQLVQRLTRQLHAGWRASLPKK